MKACFVVCLVDNPPLFFMELLFDIEGVFGCLIAVYSAENGFLSFFVGNNFSVLKVFKYIVKSSTVVSHKQKINFCFNSRNFWTRYWPMKVSETLFAFRVLFDIDERSEPSTITYIILQN